jgi:hypothetical protein
MPRARGWVPVVIASWVASASAGNVHVQIECGSPPRTAPSAHRAVAADLRIERTVFEKDLAIPEAGRVGGLEIDGRPYALPTGEIRDGFLETRDLGRIFFALSPEPPGFFLIVRPEQLHRLDETSPLVDGADIRQ